MKKTIDIQLLSCNETVASQFAELDAVTFPAPNLTMNDRLAAVMSNPRCPLERHFLAQVEEEIVGGFRILPLEMRVSPADHGWIQVGGLGRLGVYPHHRRQGIAGGVLRLVLQRSYEQNDVLSLAYPINFRTFRKYGYGIGARHMIYSVPPEGFPDDPGRDFIRPATRDDAEAINQCYEHQLMGGRGIIRRSIGAWKDYHLSNRGGDPTTTHWVYEDDEGIAGYLAAASEETGKYYSQILHVREWFATSGMAIRAFFGFFRAQSTNLSVVKLPAPLEYSLESAMVEPVYPDDPDLGPWCQPVGKLCSTLMGRIIHLPEAIEARHFEEDGSVNLLVEDWSLPANSGYYSLAVKDHRGRLDHADEGDPDIRMDISVLSSLYCGTMSAVQGRIFGLIEATEEGAMELDRLLGHTTFMIWDYF